MRGYIAWAGAVMGLAGCAPAPDSGQFNLYRAPSLPAVATPSVQGGGPDESCTPAAVAQAQRLPRVLARLRPGARVEDVTRRLGEPVRLERMELRDGPLEVLFYHTPQTICRVPVDDAGLMPVAFRAHRMVGHGNDDLRRLVAPQQP